MKSRVKKGAIRESSEEIMVISGNEKELAGRSENQEELVRRAEG